MFTIFLFKLPIWQIFPSICEGNSNSSCFSSTQITSTPYDNLQRPKRTDDRIPFTIWRLVHRITLHCRTLTPVREDSTRGEGLLWDSDRTHSIGSRFWKRILFICLSVRPSVWSSVITPRSEGLPDHRDVTLFGEIIGLFTPQWPKSVLLICGKELTDDIRNVWNARKNKLWTSFWHSIHNRSEMSTPVTYTVSVKIHNTFRVTRKETTCSSDVRSYGNVNRTLVHWSRSVTIYFTGV